MTRAARMTPAGEVTRERVVRAAMDAFVSHGYRGASLNAIAEAVGLSRQGLLHYFPSKVALLMAVLELGQQDDIALITRLVEAARVVAARNDAGDPRAQPQPARARAAAHRPRRRGDQPEPSRSRVVRRRLPLRPLRHRGMGHPRAVRRTDNHAPCLRSGSP